MRRKSKLTVTQILRWADTYHARTGKWPNVTSGPVEGSPKTTWCGINIALRTGNRGLPGGSSLAQLLERRRNVRNPTHPPPLTVGQILEWADAHRKRTGRWPTLSSGRVAEAPEETWSSLSQSLTVGRRGLPGGSTLAQTLEQRRGHRNRAELPPLTVPDILRWADAHYKRTGQWPKAYSGRWPNVKRGGTVKECPWNSWSSINSALRVGVRGLLGGSSLARLLEEHRGVRNRANLPPLTVEQILGWADAYRKRTGRWPQNNEGHIPEAPGERWDAIDFWLKTGGRGLPGNSTLARTLARYRGKRNRAALQRLTYKQILAWADSHRARTGRWPRDTSESVHEEPGTTWRSINHALVEGGRGLPGRATLAGLLARYRGKNKATWTRRTHAIRLAMKRRPRPPRLTIANILIWADRHHERTGRWPTAGSGTVYDAPGERWSGIQYALRKGRRGLRGGSSLIRLLAERRKVRNPRYLPRLTIKQILAWADEHRRLHVKWPNVHSGPVPGTPGETWTTIDAALRNGARGLPRGYSLARLLAVHRGVRNRWSLGQLTIKCH